MYTQKALAISNSPVKNISFITQYENMPEVEESKTKNRNTSASLEKATDKLHYSSLHLQPPLRHFHLDAAISDSTCPKAIYLPHMTLASCFLSIFLSSRVYNYPLSCPS